MEHVEDISGVLQQELKVWERVHCRAKKEDIFPKQVVVLDYFNCSIVSHQIRNVISSQ